jgi:carboxylate-amine ligase
MAQLGIVASMKDFYWDIRPKPEYGTVEIRVCDTPLTIETAVALAAYAQTLSKYFFAQRSLQPQHDTYLTYTYNRFQACRFGLAGTLIDSGSGSQSSIQNDILRTIEMLKEVADELGTTDAIELLRERARGGQSDAGWLRHCHGKSGSLNDVVRQQSAVWMAQ